MLRVRCMGKDKTDDERSESVRDLIEMVLAVELDRDHRSGQELV